MGSAFIDLRQNDLAENSGASFWPSFTDIMMVIVMIFMLASTVLMLRNYELVEELRNTMQAEQAAAEEARVASQTNATLEERLDQAQQHVSELRMQIMQQNEASKLQVQMLAEREARLDDLTQLNKVQSQRIEQQIIIIGQSESDLGDERSKNEKLADRLQLKSDDFSELNRRFIVIGHRLKERQQKLSDLEQQHKSSNQQLILVRGEYDQLKVKYDKLVKPARTTKGKYVVDIRYEKLKSGQTRVQYKLPGWKNFKTVTHKSLHQQLLKLKRSRPKSLYTKIIIPEDSGLSYIEAWDFMKDILDRYDYYAQ